MYLSMSIYLSKNDNTIMLNILQKKIGSAFQKKKKSSIFPIFISAILKKKKAFELSNT